MLRAEKNRRVVKAVTRALDKNLVTAEDMMRHLRLYLKRKRSVARRAKSRKFRTP